MNSDDTIMYYTAVTSGSKAVIWKFVLSGTDTIWTQLGSMIFVQTLTYVSSSKIFATTKWTSTTVGITMIEWDNTSPAWTIQRAWDFPWVVEGGANLLSTDGTKIYSAISHNAARRIHFVTYSVADGSLQSNRYRTNDTSFWYTHSIELFGGKIYIAAWYNSAPSTYLFSYDPTTDTMGTTYKTDIRFGTMLKRSTDPK